MEWRCWAAVNTFLATGIRASTLVNIKISDVDFENDTIHLSKLKNRKQRRLRSACGANSRSVTVKWTAEGALKGAMLKGDGAE